MDGASKPPLHNSPLPCLKWGGQRLMRCVKLKSGPSSGNSMGSRLSNALPPRSNTDREIPHNNMTEGTIGGASAGKAPWTLRDRRSCKTPPHLRVLETDRDVIGHFETASPKTPNCSRGSKKESETVLAKISISLTREEIEDDYIKMGRNRPSRRPKKRPRLVQKCLDSVFPGLWLSEITPDSYKISEISDP